MITIKTKQEIETMAKAGKILAKIMDEIERNIKPGIATIKLEELAEKLILKNNGNCSFKGYRGYPFCLCVSINEEIVHGMPSNRIIKQGDIVSIDLGFFYKGFHVDMARTLAIGEVNPEVQRLIQVTKEALRKGIKKIKPDNTFGDIGNAIQEYVESQGFVIIRNLCGHGIGREIHEKPYVLNYGRKGKGEKIKQGMVFCLEPIVGVGDWRIKRINEFVFQTIDNSFSCHFEHTIAVTKNGCQILTK